VPSPLLATELVALEHAMGLNQAIALCLYLAVVVPPYIDRAASLGLHVQVTLTFDEPEFVLTITGDWKEAIELDFLRSRLAEAYLRQLGGEVAVVEAPARSIRFALETPHTPHDA
jgi:hypothetical protein